MIDNIPEWLQTSIVGAVFAVAGYFGKILVDKSKEKHKEQARVISRLAQLKSLLDASRGLFIIQQSLARRLTGSLELKYGKAVTAEGYENTFIKYYKDFSEEEKVLHDLIRAYSEKSMKQINDAMRDWLTEDNDFKTGTIKSKNKAELAESLTTLETHLMLWQAKYEYWLPGHAEHALVYLADEKAHGLGFPQGLDKLVADTLNQLRRAQ